MRRTITNQPHLAGSGRAGVAMRELVQIWVWSIDLLMCWINAACVGGMCSSDLHGCCWLSEKLSSRLIYFFSCTSAIVQEDRETLNEADGIIWWLFTSEAVWECLCHFWKVFSYIPNSLLASKCKGWCGVTTTVSMDKCQSSCLVGSQCGDNLNAMYMYCNDAQLRMFLLVPKAIHSSSAPMSWNYAKATTTTPESTVLIHVLGYPL